MYYQFIENDVITCLSCKNSANTKLGKSKLIATYHFSIDQILSIDLKQDAKNCLDCPFSYSSGDGKCYTHKGTQYFGLIAMMKRLRKVLLKGEILPFDQTSFEKFVNRTQSKRVKRKPTFLRMGAYGEPIFLPLSVIKTLTAVVNNNYTGYTQQWGKKYEDYKTYLMASCHNSFEYNIAKSLNWRTFFVDGTDGINCPASDEAGKRTTCDVCALCSGTNGKGKTDIFIKNHF